MTITEARIVLDKLGWSLLASHVMGEWWMTITRTRNDSRELHQTRARKRSDAIDQIVLWAQLEAQKINAAEAAGGGA